MLVFKYASTKKENKLMMKERLRFRQEGVNSPQSQEQLALARAERERQAQEDRQRRTVALQAVATRHGLVPRRMNEELRRTGSVVGASEQFRIPGA